jgi:hypothetical protein
MIFSAFQLSPLHADIFAADAAATLSLTLMPRHYFRLRRRHFAIAAIISLLPLLLIFHFRLLLRHAILP